MDQGKKGSSNSSKKKKMEIDQKEDDQMEQAGKRFKAVTITDSFLQRIQMATRNKETETEETVTDDEETETDEETVISPKLSSTNKPKGMKKNVEQTADQNIQEEPLVISPAESSTNNPKGVKKKKKRIREEEEEEEEEIPKADSSSDTCTSTFHTPPIDKFLDSGKDKSMRSPPWGSRFKLQQKESLMNSS